MICFDVLHPYYLPQYFPVIQELLARKKDVHLVAYRCNELEAVVTPLLKQYPIAITWVSSKTEALAFYLKAKPSWIIFGGRFDEAAQLKAICKTALMQHGIGPKACYYDVSESDFDVRFVEGQYRLQRLQTLYPSKSFVDTGYAKLDPIINGTEAGIDLSALGLDPAKPTLLYAPTFYPSSIEKMAKNWPEQFSEYNILIKPHYFSLNKSSYKKQKQRLTHWGKYSNVYLADVSEINLLPFMATADILISDASSALFEFAALNKPVIWCDFYHLRWSYRGIFKYRFQQRMDKDLYRYADVAVHAESYGALKSIIEQQIAEPHSYENKRKQYTAELAGKVDGCCSERIVDYMVAS